MEVIPAGPAFCPSLNIACINDIEECLAAGRPSYGLAIPELLPPKGKLPAGGPKVGLAPARPEICQAPSW